MLVPFRHTPAGDVARLVSVPFAVDSNETVSEAVFRAGRTLGAALTSDGHRVSVPPVPASEHNAADVCAVSVSSVVIPDWETKSAVRAQLHRTGRDSSAGNVLKELKKSLLPAADGMCAQLASLFRFQQTAMQNGWLSRTLAPEHWLANVDVLVSGPEATSPSMSGIADTVAGAFATNGVSPRFVGAQATRCSDSDDSCRSGYFIDRSSPNTWTAIVEGHAWEAGALRARVVLFVDGDAIDLGTVVLAVGGTALDEPLRKAMDARR